MCLLNIVRRKVWDVFFTMCDSLLLLNKLCF